MSKIYNGASYPSAKTNNLETLFQKYYVPSTPSTKVIKQKLINFCLEKARMLQFNYYVTESDILEIRDLWSAEEVELVCNKISAASDAMFCPWCRYGYNVKGHHFYKKRCGECTYGKRHGQCGFSVYSDYSKFLNKAFGSNIRGNLTIMLTNDQQEYLLNILK